ncbi:uncharacterized protein LOC143044669 isoform X1 [Mytilus galloprovincialis]|uniref:uncharacterized protein LOC143044669 isoform X1 n=1 Tax=Mytilus galloprovincialis TaxID=29158 RepID=UPI003F7B408E
MDDSKVILFLVVMLIFIRLYSSEENVIYERLLCENSTVKLQCPGDTLVEDINITAFSDVDEDSCILPKETTEETNSLNQEPTLSCIGQNSCQLTDKMINTSKYADLERTRKLHVKYNCVLENRVNVSRPDQTVCPSDMSSVLCNLRTRQVLVLAVNLTHETFVCSTPDLYNTCRRRIKESVKISCNKKRRCESVWNTSLSTLDECIKIPKRFKIVFTCKESRNANSMESEYNVAGVSVGVTTGVVVILGAVVVMFWFAKRKARDNILSRSLYTDADASHPRTPYDKLNCKTVTNKTYENPDAVIPCVSHRQDTPQKHNGSTPGHSVFGTADKNTELSPDPYSYVNNCNTSPTALMEYDTVNHYEIPIAKEDSDTASHVTDDDEYSYDISRHADLPDQHQGLYNRNADSMYDKTFTNSQENITNQTYDHCRSDTNT